MPSIPTEAHARKACADAPGQSEVFQGSLKALVTTWQHMPISPGAQTSPYVSHKVYHLHREGLLLCLQGSGMLCCAARVSGRLTHRAHVTVLI